jgi:hypothetical protein
LNVFSRAATLAVLLVCSAAAMSFAQDTATDDSSGKQPTVSLFFARTGQSLTAPYPGTIHYLEFLQIRNRWIYPDVGYIDFAHDNYREYFVGGGRTLMDTKSVSWDQELLYLGTAGSAAAGAKYLQPWSMLRLRFTPKFTNETVYFAYFPLNDSAKFHHVIERSKFEYALKTRWKIGAGYAGGNRSGGPWVNRPMITTTVSTKAGAFELWLQKIPGGAQVELRYAMVHVSR